MSTFTAETYQNEYLADGGTEVNAIVTVTSDEADPSGGGSGAEATEVIIVDVSGSMGVDGRIHAAKQATKAAVSVLRDGVQFAVIAGSGLAQPCFPPGGLAVSSPHTRAQAAQAVDRLRAEGGTAIGSWLDSAGMLFHGRPGVKHAILLTDGKNEGEPPGRVAEVLRQWKGTFQCDCRGVGTDWVVSELRPIAAALLGTVDIVARPDGLVADFTRMVNTAMGRTNADVRLRVWLPVGAQLRFIKQVAPDVADLTGTRIEVNARSADYPTGAWGAESRDYHVCVEVAPGSVGDEMLAARVSLVTGGPEGDVVTAQSLVRAVWTEDSALSTRINKSVAHYTGQAELADVIAEGLEARKAGDDDTATMKFGRAAQLAAASGNTGTQELLAKVVDIDDPVTGTVRLKKRVDDADEMALDTRSTRTVRVGKAP